MGTNDISFIDYQHKKQEIFNSIGRIDGYCRGISCGQCPLNDSKMNCHELEFLQPERAIEQILKSETQMNWTKVKIDTPIYVRDCECDEWSPRYFAWFKDGKIYAWENGATSFSANGGVTSWKYAKLA